MSFSMDVLSRFNALVRSELLYNEDGSCANWVGAHALSSAMASVSTAELGPKGFVIAHVGAGKSTYVATHPNELDVIDVDVAFIGSEDWAETKELIKIGEWQQVRARQLEMIRRARIMFSRRIVFVQSYDIMELVLRAFDMDVTETYYVYVSVPTHKMEARLSRLGGTRASLWEDNAQSNTYDADTDGVVAYPSIESAMRSERQVFRIRQEARQRAALSRAVDLLDLWSEERASASSWATHTRLVRREGEVFHGEEEQDGAQSSSDSESAVSDGWLDGDDGELSDEEMTNRWLVMREEHEAWREARGLED